uniref:Uncharacterized protein n=1 Tax=Triticum urartu TaxID=4572 RepID=A0A8R7V7A2_TRIUA
VATNPEISLGWPIACGASEVPGWRERVRDRPSRRSPSLDSSPSPRLPPSLPPATSPQQLPPPATSPTADAPTPSILPLPSLTIDDLLPSPLPQIEQQAQIQRRLRSGTLITLVRLEDTMDKMLWA